MQALSPQLKPILLPLVLLLPACGSDRVSAAEVDRIVDVLGIEVGMRVADVGAGDGDWSLALAEQVGETGHVFATEVDEDEIRKIEKRLERSGVSNVSLLLGHQMDTGLPPGCCGAVLLRMVYHHFVDPSAMLDSIGTALQPGGLLGVIDIVPQQHWRRLPEVPDRGGHGIPPDELVDEITSHGFDLVARHDRWNGDVDRYCVVFRVSRAAEP